jgi:5-methylcytosine-specific restriction endonuclease McrA
MKDIRARSSTYGPQFQESLSDPTLRQWQSALDFFEEKCAYCSSPSQVLEHYLPLSLGGGTTIANCLPSCKRCNLRKRDKHPDHFTALFPTDNIRRIKEYWNSIM